jgi:hypothetical protein
MRSTFPSASYPACGDDRMYDLHHGLLGPLRVCGKVVIDELVYVVLYVFSDASDSCLPDCSRSSFAPICTHHCSARDERTKILLQLDGDVVGHGAGRTHNGIDVDIEIGQGPGRIALVLLFK